VDEQVAETSPTPTAIPGGREAASDPGDDVTVLATADLGDSFMRLEMYESPAGACISRSLVMKPDQLSGRAAGCGLTPGAGELMAGHVGFGAFFSDEQPLVALGDVPSEAVEAGFNLADGSYVPVELVDPPAKYGLRMRLFLAVAPAAPEEIMSLVAYDAVGEMVLFSKLGPINFPPGVLGNLVYFPQVDFGGTLDAASGVVGPPEGPGVTFIMPENPSPYSFSVEHAGATPLTLALGCDTGPATLSHESGQDDRGQGIVAIDAVPEGATECTWAVSGATGDYRVRAIP
jgi:hypothetical protein